MKHIFRMMLFTLLMVVLSACANDDLEEETAADGEDTNNSQEGGGDLTVAIPSDVVSLDPHGSNDDPSEQLRDVVYEGLLTQDDNLEITEALAVEWEQIDEVTWEFELRENVTFHDGSTFDAYVVKANIDRIQDPALASPRAFLLDMIEEVEIIDDYNIRLITEYPFAPLLSNLTHGAGKMISSELIDEDYENALSEAGEETTLEEYYELRESGGDEFTAVSDAISSYTGMIVEQQPSGTNYLQFESRSPGESTVFTRYDDYWNDPAILDSVTFKVVTEVGSRIAELETGASDFVVNVQSSNIERIEENEDITLVRKNALSVDYIGFNTQKEPFDNPDVRRAITHAFDSEAVLSGVYNDSGVPAVGPIPPGVTGYSDSIERPEYNVERAKELLEEAGYGDGFEATLMVNEDNPERMSVALFLQEALTELNIDLSIDQVEWGAFLESTSNAEHEMFMLGWGNTTGDPDDGIMPMFHSDNIGSSGNRSFFQNETLDALLDEAARETDEDVRQELYEEATALVVDQAPVIFVRHGEYLNAISNNVEGIVIDNYNIFDFREASFID